MVSSNLFGGLLFVALVTLIEWAGTPQPHLWFIPVTVSCVYLVLVSVLGVRWSSSSSKVYKPTHNLILSAWSAIMFLAAIVVMFMMPFDEVLCPSSSSFSSPPFLSSSSSSSWSWSWSWLLTTVLRQYHYSKYFELIDTLLMPSSSPSLFLHVYHHFTVVITTFFWSNTPAPTALIGVAFNTFVHVFMYYYYYLSCTGREVWWKRYITVTQIVQFVTSFLFALFVLYKHFNEHACHGMPIFYASMLFNGTLLILFIQFFITSAKRPSKRKLNETTTTASTGPTKLQ